MCRLRAVIRLLQNQYWRRETALCAKFTIDWLIPTPFIG